MLKEVMSWGASAKLLSRKMVFRARIVLLAADRRATRSIARELDTDSGASKGVLDTAHQRCILWQ
jgi:hypothetical protein